MTLEEAIRTAIEYEVRVQGVYAGAEQRAPSDVGRRVFRVLAREESGHVQYLRHKLEQWQSTGKVTAEHLASAIPSPEAIARGVEKLENRLASTDRGTELELLGKALAVEKDTSGYYERLVAELGPEGRDLFGRFVEIEKGHQAIVQAEIDSISGTGFWFDMPEFNLEAE